VGRELGIEIEISLEEAMELRPDHNLSQNSEIQSGNFFGRSKGT
jgi:hypothetical protein